MPTHPRLLRPLPALRLAAALSALGGLTGCLGIGPHALKTDQVDYARALGEAKKREILAAAVGLRYADSPAFLTVTQIIAAYQVDLTGQTILNSRPDPGGPLAQATGTAMYSDHPTFTFTPATGEAYAAAYIRPLAPALVLPLAGTGVPIDLLLRIVAQSVGGLNNGTMLGGPSGNGSPEFFELLRVLRRLQLAGELNVEYRETNHVGRVILSLGLAEGAEAPANAEDLARARTLLHLSSRTHEYALVETGTAQPDTIPLTTRSILGILGDIGAEIGVPGADVGAGATKPTLELVGGETRPIIIVHSGPHAPGGAYVAVRYRRSAYWIDPDDFDSKYAFTVVQDLVALAEAGDTSKAPIVTIPAN